MRRSSTLSSLWASPDFRALCGSQVLAGLGEWLATMAMIALVWDRTHSAIMSGVVLALRILPAALLGSFLGTFVDRFDRKRVLVAATAGRAVVYGSLPFVGGIGPVIALALVAEVASLAYISARDATLPRLVPEKALPAANAVSMASAYGAMPIGSGLFALFAALFGSGGSVAVGLASAGGLLGLATIAVGRVKAHMISEARGEKHSCEKTSFRAGISALREVFRADPILRRVGLGGAVAATGGGVIITLGLAYVRGTLHAGSGAYSGLLVAFCGGVLVGIVSLQKARRFLHHVFHAGIGAMGAILVSMALFPSIAMGFGMGFVFGGAFVATFLGGITILQDRIHDSLRGRAFALAHSGLRVSAVLMGVLGAWVAKSLGSSQRSIGLFHLDGNQLVLGAVGTMLVITALGMLRPARPAAVAVAVSRPIDG